MRQLERLALIYSSVRRLKESFTSCVNDCDNDWFIIRRGVTATAIPRLHFIAGSPLPDVGILRHMDIILNRGGGRG